MDMANPQQWNGYAYANNNPATLSDPTGLIAVAGDHVTSGDVAIHNKKVQEQARNRAKVSNTTNHGSTSGKKANQAWDPNQPWIPAPHVDNCQTYGHCTPWLYKLLNPSPMEQAKRWNEPPDRVTSAINALSGYTDAEECIGHGVWLSCAAVAPNPFSWIKRARGVTKAVRVERVVGSPFDNLKYATTHGIKPYSALRKVTAGHAGEIQAHHLIEKRFARRLGGNTNDWPSVVLARDEHKVFTDAWRKAIPYGRDGTAMASRADVELAARQIYGNYPEFLKALGL